MTTIEQDREADMKAIVVTHQAAGTAGMTLVERLCLPRISFFLETLTLLPSADRVRRCDPSLSRCS